jgi:hypothetical protein
MWACVVIIFQVGFENAAQVPFIEGWRPLGFEKSIISQGE